MIKAPQAHCRFEAYYRRLGEIERTSAPYRVNPGAIYLHQGESFLVRELDLEAGYAILAPVQVNYYTQPSTTTLLG
jgi:DEAD/DEAH box helicase domain-containing protein